MHFEFYHSWILSLLEFFREILELGYMDDQAPWNKIWKRISKMEIKFFQFAWINVYEIYRTVSCGIFVQHVLILNVLGEYFIYNYVFKWNFSRPLLVVAQLSVQNSWYLSYFTSKTVLYISCIIYCHFKHKLTYANDAIW